MQADFTTPDRPIDSVLVALKPIDLLVGPQVAAAQNEEDAANAKGATLLSVVSNTPIGAQQRPTLSHAAPNPDRILDLLRVVAIHVGKTSN